MGAPSFRALMEQSVPVVKAPDIKRVWSFLASERTPGTSAPIGICMRLLANHCDADSNVFAVCLRAMLVETLLQQGLLEEWRVGDGLRESVFEVAATIPLSRGLSDIDPKAFIAALQ